MPIDGGIPDTGGGAIPDEGSGGTSGQTGIVANQQYIGYANIISKETKVNFKPPYITNSEMSRFHDNLIKEIESLKLNIATLKVNLAQANSQISYLQSITNNINVQMDNTIERLYD